MRAATLLPCLTLSLVAPLPALANDSSAELRAGGLVLTRNADIEMRSEDLYISAKQVRVNYVFYNRAPQPVTIRVAFPMPDVAGTEEPQSIPTEDPTNILAFRTVVNGQPVRAEVEQRAFVGGVEYTQFLRALNIPLAPHLRSTAEALDRLPKEKWPELAKLQIAEPVEYDQGKGMEKHLEPRWTLKTTWHWQQTFAPNAETRVEHSYTPATGASAGTSVGNRELQTEDWFADYRRKYCMDRDFINSAMRAHARAEANQGPALMEKRVAYILTTGANWAGPIRDFRLVIDKGEPGNIVSFCGEGVRKISPTQFEIRRQNFTPAQDLDILILEPMPRM